MRYLLPGLVAGVLVLASGSHAQAGPPDSWYRSGYGGPGYGGTGPGYQSKSFSLSIWNGPGFGLNVNSGFAPGWGRDQGCYRPVPPCPPPPPPPPHHRHHHGWYR